MHGCLLSTYMDETPVLMYNSGKLEIFRKNGKIIIMIINCNNGLGKPRKFSKSRIMKRTAPLDSSLVKSSDPEKFHLILR